MVYSSAQRGDSVKKKKKESVLICDKNKEIEYLCDGPIEYPPRREVTEEEKRIIEERHKELGIED